MSKSKNENPFEIDFDSYIRQGEPEKKEKSIAWAIATGLQQVDGLTPSKYLYETAKRNIEGEITINEAKELIDSYYESKSVRTDDDDEKEEADKVSARITELLSEQAFTFSTMLIYNKSSQKFAIKIPSIKHMNSLEFANE